MEFLNIDKARYSDFKEDIILFENLKGNEMKISNFLLEMVCSFELVFTNWLRFKDLFAKQYTEKYSSKLFNLSDYFDDPMECILPSSVDEAKSLFVNVLNGWKIPKEIEIWLVALTYLKYKSLKFYDNFWFTLNDFSLSQSVEEYLCEKYDFFEWFITDYKSARLPSARGLLCLDDTPYIDYGLIDDPLDNFLFFPKDYSKFIYANELGIDVGFKGYDLYVYRSFLNMLNAHKEGFIHLVCHPAWDLD
ncbi:hypothetical protein [Saprospira grandis]|uniref:Uncharacterized protein n=1 Tax=Saprospira grandis (strain Lewin) TaxID=984262 RepID=H6L8H2_SAPGL|nr:hypothetical protein [Saprospira grandis]AFC26697.1 hypothetical protein SGRA_3982 [Saprospira grandis str. Lewin]